jgi:hypothetical protein
MNLAVQKSGAAAVYVPDGKSYRMTESGSS